MNDQYHPKLQERPDRKEKGSHQKTEHKKHHHHGDGKHRSSHHRSHHHKSRNSHSNGQKERMDSLAFSHKSSSAPRETLNNAVSPSLIPNDGSEETSKEYFTTSKLARGYDTPTASIAEDCEWQAFPTEDIVTMEEANVPVAQLQSDDQTKVNTSVGQSDTQNHSRVCYPLPYVSSVQNLSRGSLGNLTPSLHLHPMNVEQQGGSVFAPIVVMIIAYILFAIAAFSCDSFEYTYEDPYAYDSSSQSMKYGYWGVMVTDEVCISYNNEFSALLGLTIDAPLKAGRAIGATGAAIGGLAIIFMVLPTFMVISKAFFPTVGILVGISMALFSLILPIGMTTEGCIDDDAYSYYDETSSQSLNCRPTVKGYLAGGAFILWIVGTSIICCCMGKPRE